jgi:hypothetical protein
VASLLKDAISSVIERDSVLLELSSPFHEPVWDSSYLDLLLADSEPLIDLPDNLMRYTSHRELSMEHDGSLLQAHGRLSS